MIRWILNTFGLQQQKQDDKEIEQKSRREQEEITDEFDDLPALEDEPEEEQSRERERAERKLEEERRLAREREMAEKLKDLELKLKKEEQSRKEAERKLEEEKLAKERETAEKVKELELKLKKEEQSRKEAEEKLAKEREMAEKFKELELKLGKEEESRKEAEKKLEEERPAKERDRKIILEYEERQKQKETELLTKIQELARQQVTQLKDEQAKERKRNKEEVASDSVSNSQQKPSEKELLIKALEQIIEHPDTVIHPKPIYSETEYHKDEPFNTIEAFVSKLKPGYTSGVCELFEAIKAAQEPLRVEVSELLGKIPQGVVGEIPKIEQVEINVYDLDDRFGMISRMERVLDNSALRGEPSSSMTGRREESELMFGSSKGGRPVVLQFEASKESGCFKVKSVTERSIEEYTEGVKQGQGVVLTARKQGHNVYTTQRRVGKG